MIKCRLGLRYLLISLLVSLLSAAAATGLPAAAHADSDDHDRALLLRHKGEILPLAGLLARIEKQYPGQLLEVELEEHGERIVYEFELLGEDGAVREIVVDAVSGEVIKVKNE